MRPSAVARAAVHRYVQASPIDDRTSLTHDEVISDRYELRREAGRGGMCVVYEARNRFTGRAVALKRLLPDYAHNQEACARLMQEAIAIGMVRHPNVVDVLDAGQADGHPYVVMEMLVGRSLEGLLAARGTLGIREVVDIGRKAAAALASVHHAGIVHRDMKPGNLLLLEGEAFRRDLKLIDFGLARVPSTSETSAKLSRATQVMGTPEYLPLESLTASGMVAPTIDVYALGVTLYECLVGVVPFEGNYAQVLTLAATRAPRPIQERRPDVPVALADFVMKAIAREPVDRFADGAAMATALDAVERALGAPVAPPPLPAAPSPRRYKRLPFITPVRIRFDGGLLEGRSEDLSEGGLMVLLPTPLPEGTKVQVRFALPRTGEICACPAVVRWIRGREARACAVGLELVDVPPRIRNLIAECVQSGGV